MHLTDAPPIDKDFSVYRWLVENYQVQMTLRHRLTMHLVSHEIENATLIDQARNRIFSGFQRFSRFIPQVDHYRKMAQQAEQVFVFGVPDVTLPMLENVTYVPISAEHQLAHEWFLLSYGSDYFSVLGAEEITDPDVPNNVRLFKGSWTFDLDLVLALEERLSQIVGIEPFDKALLKQDFVRQIQLMSKSIQRMTTLQPDPVALRQSNWMMISGELRTAMRNEVQSAILRLSMPEHYSQQLERFAVICVSIGGIEETIEQKQPIHDHVDKVVNPYFEEVSKAITSARGTLNHYEDDYVLAFFDIEPEATQLDFLVDLGHDIIKKLRSKLPAESVVAIGVGIVYGEMLLNEMKTDTASYRNVTGDVGLLAQRLSDAKADQIRVSLSAYQQLSDKVGFQRDRSLKPHHVFTKPVG